MTPQRSDSEQPRPEVSIHEIAPARAKKHSEWSWADEDRSIRTRMCLCCGRPGHYQQVVEAYIREHGMDGLGVYVRDGYAADGHHRIVAAIALGIDRIPLETQDDAGARWVRDHGYVDWSERKFGDE